MWVRGIVAALAASMVSACGGEGMMVEVRSLSDSPDAEGVPMTGLWLGVGDARERVGRNGRAGFDGLSGSVEICAYGFSQRPEPTSHSCVTVQAGGRVTLRFSDAGLVRE